MKIFASGVFGLQVRQLLDNLAPSHAAANGDADTIVVSDAFEPTARHWHPDFSDPSRRAYCFLTTRGLFVSCWLSPAGPCSQCFEKRWYANLALWDHAPAQERMLQALNTHRPGIRLLPTPDSVAVLAAHLLSSLIDDGRESRLCRYVDLVSCQVTPSAMWPISGCGTCRPSSVANGKRYRSGFHDAFASLAVQP